MTARPAMAILYYIFNTLLQNHNIKYISFILCVGRITSSTQAKWGPTIPATSGPNTLSRRPSTSQRTASRSAVRALSRRHRRVQISKHVHSAVLALGERWYIHEFDSKALAGTKTVRWPTRSDLRRTARVPQAAGMAYRRFQAVAVRRGRGVGDPQTVVSR